MLGRHRIGDVAELGMLFDEGSDHRAGRDDTLSVGPGGLQRFVDQNRGQAASAELLVDLGVEENPLITPVGDGRQADGLAVDRDGVLPVLGADGGFGAGFIECHGPIFAVA